VIEPLIESLGAFAAVVGSELRRWRRQRLTVASSLVFPVAMAALVTFALGGETPELRFTFAVVDQEHGPTADAFVDQAVGHPALAKVVDTRLVASRRAADRLLDDDEADAVVVLPEGLGARLAGRPDDRDVGIEVEASNPLAGGLATMVVDRFVIRARTEAVAVARTGRAPSGPWPLQVGLTAPGGRRLDAARHYGPGIGMFFVLVGMGFAAQRFVADRRRGLADRIAATPASPVAVAFGRAVAALAVGALSLGTTAVTMQILFGRRWGPPLAVVVLATATVVALAGVAGVVAAVSRTPEQATVVGAGVAFVFALASGTFSPPGSIGARPAFADLVPTTHALDGFAVLATEQSGVTTVLGPIGVLCGFGVAGGIATALLTRRFA
jgi:ABC-type multidrug transport system permease subunit